MQVDKQRIAELVGRIQNGDNAAFDELYRLTSERAYFVALELTKNNQDAEDILQESYIKALSKINELDKPESFSSWLNQIVANKSKDYLKKKKPMLFEAEEHEVFEVIPDEDTSFSPEDNLDQTELQKTVMEVLDELSEEKRACVLMMYYEEMSVGEIAETLEIPEGTVKTRLFSARKDLKSKFEKRGITSLYSAAPIGVVIWAIRRTSEAVRKTFAASPASAKVLAGITVAGTGTAAGVAAAGTTAATGTGIAARIAALSVAQKAIAGVSVAAVVTGSAVGVVTVANNNGNETPTTTGYVEEFTTAPIVETTLVLQAGLTVDFSQTTVITDISETPQNGQSEKQTSEKSLSSQATTKNKATEKSTGSASTSKATTVKQTTTTKKATTTAKSVTTEKPTTTKAITKATTTKPTTAKPATTTVKPTTTTTKPTTTEATTEATTLGKATVSISVIDLDGYTVIDTVTDTITAGETISKNYLWDLVEAEGYTISDVYDGDIGTTAEAGRTYTFKADIFEV